MSSTVNRRAPLASEPKPVSLINLDPAAAARSIAAVVAEKNDEKDWLNEKVWIQFYNLEEPGQKGFFMYGICTDPKKIEIEHGEVRELTRGDVRYIESRQTPIYEYKADVTSGKRKKHLQGWRARYQCRQVNQRTIGK